MSGGPIRSRGSPPSGRDAPAYAGLVAAVSPPAGPGPSPRSAGDDPAKLSGRAGGARAPRHQRAGGEPAQPDPPCQRLRRPRAVLDLPDPGDGRQRRRAHARPAPSGRCWSASPPARGCASPASSGPRPTWPWCRCCRRSRACARPTCSTGRSPARSASSWRCSSTCAARRGSPRSACPTTRCSSSTASSARSATPCGRPAARPTSSSATVCSRCSAWRRSPNRPPGTPCGRSTSSPRPSTP